MRIIGIFALAAAAVLAGEAAAAQPAPRQCFSTRDIQTVAPQDDFTVNIGTWSHEVYLSGQDDHRLSRRRDRPGAGL